MKYADQIQMLREAHEALLNRKNVPVTLPFREGTGLGFNGIYTKYQYPILTAEHTPLEWRYDFCEQTNPYLMQRIMMNAVLNAGAIFFEGKYTVVARVEGDVDNLGTLGNEYALVRLQAVAQLSLGERPENLYPRMFQRCYLNNRHKILCLSNGC